MPTGILDNVVRIQVYVLMRAVVDDILLAICFRLAPRRPTAGLLFELQEGVNEPGKEPFGSFLSIILCHGIPVVYLTYRLQFVSAF